MRRIILFISIFYYSLGNNGNSVREMSENDLKRKKQTNKQISSQVGKLEKLRLLFTNPSVKVSFVGAMT